MTSQCSCSRSTHHHYCLIVLQSSSIPATCRLKSIPPSKLLVNCVLSMLQRLRAISQQAAWRLSRATVLHCVQFLIDTHRGRRHLFANDIRHACLTATATMCCVTKQLTRHCERPYSRLLTLETRDACRTQFHKHQLFF